MGRILDYGMLSRSWNSEFMADLVNKMENNGKWNLRMCLCNKAQGRRQAALENSMLELRQKPEFLITLIVLYAY